MKKLILVISSLFIVESNFGQIQLDTIDASLVSISQTSVEVLFTPRGEISGVGNPVEVYFKVPIGQAADINEIQVSSSSVGLASSQIPFDFGGFRYYVFEGQPSIDLSTWPSGVSQSIGVFLIISNAPSFNLAAIQLTLTGGDFNPVSTGSGFFWPGTSISTNTTNTNLVAWPVNQSVNILPVTIYSFLAEPHTPTDAMVTWKTATEENSDFFAIERSINGQDWTHVGTMPAAGNSTAQKDYHFLDEKVYDITQPTSIFYYRLKMVDIDGAYEYSQVEAVIFNGVSVHNYLDVQIFPNPTVKEVNIQIHQVTQPITEILLKDVTGRVVSRTLTNLESGDHHRLNLTQERISTGIYFLDFRAGSQRIASKKLIVTQ